MNLGFVGLGQMGRPMVERLKGAGHALKVYNRTRSSPAVLEKPEAVLDAELVITMLADDAAVRAVWLDTGLAARLPKGSIHLNMATVSMGIARELTAIHKGAYVAAPVFGRPPLASIQPEGFAPRRSLKIAYVTGSPKKCEHPSVTTEYLAPDRSNILVGL